MEKVKLLCDKIVFYILNEKWWLFVDVSALTD